MKNKILQTVIMHYITCSIAHSENYNIFITTGQSNAGFNNFSWSEGVRDTLISSGQFENPIILSTWHSGRPLNEWFDIDPQQHYQADFFNSSGTGALQQSINNLMVGDNTVSFRGLFWFQGESDGLGVRGGSVSLYSERWNGMLSALDTDIGDSSWNYVMNTVGNSGPEINNAFESITSADQRGILFDTQVIPYRTNPSDIHGYDHYQVGVGNAEVFLDAFVPEPSSTTLLSIAAIAAITRRRRKNIPKK